MRTVFSFILGIIVCTSCTQDEDSIGDFQLERIVIGDVELVIGMDENTDIPVDRPISLYFSAAIDPQSIEEGLVLMSDIQPIPYTFSLFSGNHTITLYPTGTLSMQARYHLRVIFLPLYIPRRRPKKTGRSICQLLGAKYKPHVD